MHKKKIKELIIGTNNQGKVREIKKLLPKKLVLNTPKRLKIESPNETGTSAKIKPVNDFEKNGAPCRDFEQIITRDGKQYIEKSTACRDESGNWKIV